MKPLLTWCRRHLPWSNSRRSWEERIGTLALLAGGVALWWYGDRMLPAVQVLLWAVLVVVAAVLLRRGWLKLFGPVLFYDMVRSARRGRYMVMRFLYAGLLFIILMMMYVQTEYYHRWSALPPWLAADIAQDFFEALMAVQLVATVLLTPAYVAGAIADEKSRKTLEFLLATDLSSREIVLSKLCSRLANLAVFLITGLPILSVIQFLGGVDPNLVLTGYAATALTMLSLGGVSILTSTYCKRPRDAIAVAYLLVFAYFAVAFALIAVVAWLGFNTSFTLPSATDSWGDHLLEILGEVARIANFGNVWLALHEVQMAGYRGALATELPRLLREYALFHGTVAAICGVWSVLRLRPVAIRQMSSSKGRQRSLLGGPRRRPPVGDLPMLWKELNIEGGSRLHWIVWLIALALVVISFLPAFMILHARWFDYGLRSADDYYLYAAMNSWVRITTALVVSVTLLAVAIRAATCVSSERDRQTLDSLLTTPLSASQILAAKTLGNVASVRWAWAWLGAMWLTALLAGGLHPFAIPFLMGAWLTYAFFVALLGTWYSIVCRTSQRAIVFTMLALAGLTLGHWLPWGCCLPYMYYGGGGEIRHLHNFQLGMTPPVAVGYLAFFAQDFRADYYSRHHDENVQVIGYSVCGLFLWACAALFLWSVVLSRFRLLTLRSSEGPFPQHQRPYYYVPEPRQGAEGAPAPRGPTGAVLLHERNEPLEPRGAILIEEIQEPPPHKDNE